MKGLIGYKQCLEHFNSTPEIKNQISELSNITTSRYSKNNLPTSSVVEFLKRPVKYHFSLTTKQANLPTLFHHACYFDTKETAEKEHKKLKLKLYDQQTKPYLDKITKGKVLTQQDKQSILTIIDTFSKLR